MSLKKKEINLKNFFNDNKVVISNYFSLTILQAANYILPLVILPFLVRVLGAEKFGLVMFAQSLCVFLVVFVDYGFNISGTREIAVNKDDKDKISEIFSAIMIIKIGLILTALFLLFVIVNSFSRFRIDSSIYYLSFGIVIGQALFPTWFFQGIEKMKFVTLVNIIAKVIFTLLVFILIKQESDYIYVPVYNSLGFIVAGLLGLIMSFKYVNFTMPSLALIKKLLYESTSLFISNFATMLYTSSNVFILGIFTGNTTVGVYSSMEKLILAVKNIYSPLYQALYPWLAKQDDKKKNDIIKKMSPSILALGVIISLTILFFGETILNLIYNDQLISSYAIIFKILSLIAIFSGLNMLYNALYLPAIKKYKLRMNILITGGVFNLILSLVFVKFFGIYGTAFSVTTTEFFLLILGFYFFNKRSKA